MNTAVVLWGKWLRERIGELGLRIERLGVRIEQLGLRLCAWSVAKQRQQETDDDGFPVIHLSEKAKKRLAKISDEIDAGVDMSPAFETKEEMDAYLDEAVRKYREGKE